MNIFIKKCVVIILALIFFNSCSAKEDHNDKEIEKMFESIENYQEKNLYRTNDNNFNSKVSTSISYEDITEIQKGTLFDTYGISLSYSTLNEDYSFSRVYNEEYCESFSNVLSYFSGGLETSFDSILSTPNPTQINGNYNVGKSIQLTYNAKTQKELYNYMKNMNIVGSIVVMRTDGSILSEVSYPSFDANAYGQGYTDVEGTPLNNLAELGQAPGSTFKMISKFIADFEDIGPLTDDASIVIDNYEVPNAYTNYNWPCEIDSNEAFVRSSNVYFAQAFQIIGSQKIQELANRYFLFEGPIELDFTTIRNELGVIGETDAMICRAGFGQGKVLTSPLYLAMLVREVIFGNMVKAFSKQNIVNTSDYKQIINEGSKHNEIIASIKGISDENIVKDNMFQVANNANIIMDDYNIYCKTGTAERDNKCDILYIAGYCERKDTIVDVDKYFDNYQSYDKENGSYIIVLQATNPNEMILTEGLSKYEYASDMNEIYKNIISIVYTTNKSD